MSAHPGRPGSRHYFRKGCRCDECAVASNAAIQTMHAQRRVRRRAAIEARPSKPEPIEVLRELIARPTDECIRWVGGFTAAGYGTFKVDGATVYAHVFACEQANGERPDGLQAAHSCGNPGCCNPRHLRWATRKENMADQIEHGTRRRGERMHNTKLTEAQVREIRAIRASQPLAVVAERFGVSVVTVSDVRSGRRWGWLAA